MAIGWMDFNTLHNWTVYMLHIKKALPENKLCSANKSKSFVAANKFLTTTQISSKVV